ncbi:unnamed protein product [Phaedon cochleariae]|uniref:Fatty acyl-CoA reductase n=1 Tax=Phaedon cochleariae TaxID=80249 RepID=A0A9P0DIR3_PHACE|nr:unnamed protein product [Phaedon cochleariae]
MEDHSHIQEFYKGRNVFITGGTGFMGKTLIEKLLRSTEVNTLYLLIREKKGKNIHTRIDELFDDVVFDRLKRECPKFRHRIETVPGDCCLSGLGLSIADRRTLVEKVHVVFHVAATLRFDENLKVAYGINVNGAKDVVNLARQMENLKSLVHVSTAYSNCPYGDIEEKVYECPINYEHVQSVIEKVSKAEVELITPRILGNWPNTYTFTKALAENMLKDIGAGLPIAIFRPSIVISTYKEPIPGWIDNLYGPTGVVAGAISGVLRVVANNPDNTCDLVPVDTCVAGLVAAAWDVSSKDSERSTGNIVVYNYVSSEENRLTWGEFHSLNLIQGYKNPSANSLWEVFVLVTPNMFLYWLLRILLHTLPGAMMDFAAILTGNKPRVTTLYKKIHKFTDILLYFSIRSWKFSNKNTQNLWQKLSEKDKQLFPLSLKTVCWLEYFRTYIKGVRKHLLKESDDTLESALRRNKRFSMIGKVLKYGLIFVACSTLSRMISNVYSFIL